MLESIGSNRYLDQENDGRHGRVRAGHLGTLWEMETAKDPGWKGMRPCPRYFLWATVIGTSFPLVNRDVKTSGSDSFRGLD